MAKKAKKTLKRESQQLEDWVSCLVKRSTEAGTTTTKQQRIAKRAAKKRRREERKVKPDAPSDYGTDVAASTREKRSEMREKKSKQLLTLTALEMHKCVKALMAHGSGRGDKYEGSGIAKARKRKRMRNEENTQPRNRDYGGIGLARPSIYLNLDDPGFSRKLEDEFGEHIPGMCFVAFLEKLNI